MTTKGARQFGRHRLRGAVPGKADRTHDYAFGAVPQGDGTVRFRLWAPAIEQVALAIEGREPIPMIVCSDGFHELRCPCELGTRYRYQIGPDRYIPDPASRLQMGDVHDASVVVDTNAYSWRNADWRGRPWTEVVLYEIHVGLAGGFRGVKERLADLADLGVTAIELMPIADFPGERNWGYDGAFPYAPDCSYGSPSDLMELIDTAHGMGLMVFLDVVYNHFGPEGSYLTACAPEFFRQDLQTPWGAAIDFRRRAVRAFFAENALYWLREYRFDGLRLDAVHAISDDTWLPEMASFVRKHLGRDRHVHLVVENDDNDASLLTAGFDAQWNDDAHHVLHHLLTDEQQGYYSAYADEPEQKLLRVLTQGFVYQGQASPTRQGKPRGKPSGHLPPTAFVFFLQNHDQTGNRALGERLISLCQGDPQRLQAAVALQLMTPHIPLLFAGEEYGVTAPFQYFTSFKDAQLAAAVRDGRRREFAAFPQFAQADAREGIPDPNDKQTWDNCHYASEGTDEDSIQWRAWYAHLLKLRKQWITPYLAQASSVSAQVLGPQAIVARWRLGNGSLLTIYCNLSQHTVSLGELAPDSDQRVVLESRADEPADTQPRQLLAASTIATITAADGATHAAASGGTTP